MIVREAPCRAAVSVALAVSLIGAAAAQPTDDSALHRKWPPAAASIPTHVDATLWALRDGGAVPEAMAGPEEGTILVDALGADTAALLADLEAVGLRDGRRAGGLVTGALPLASIAEAARLESLDHLRAMYRPTTRVGTVDTQGDVALRAALARDAFAVNGSGVAVCVLSNSYDLLGGAAASVAAGDLPGAGNPNGLTEPVDVVLEADGTPEANIDEGRAMLEIIHDIAPGATLRFATAAQGPLAFAAGVDALAERGCDVIVDDIGIASQPWFQDGIVAQAIDRAVRAGTTYVAAAGNAGRTSYESEFRASPAQTVSLRDGGLIGEYVLHDFDPDPDRVDNFQKIVIAPGQRLDAFLQWDDPYASACEGCPGADTDVDVFVATEDGNYASIVNLEPTGLFLDNVGFDPFDRTGSLFNELTDESLTVYLLIGRFADPTTTGPDPGRVKWISFPTPLAEVEYGGDAGTVVGSANARGAIAVGSTDYRAVGPDPRANPPALVASSSAGGVPILFDTRGRRLDEPELRVKPEVVAPTAVNTSFFGVDLDGDGFPNFTGTSAAAPHVAGVAALMIEAAGGAATPAALRFLLARTAADMDDPLTPRFDRGFDFASGFGFVLADEAVERASSLAGGGALRGTLSSSSSSFVDGCSRSLAVRVRVDGTEHDQSVDLDERCR